MYCYKHFTYVYSVNFQRVLQAVVWQKVSKTSPGHLHPLILSREILDPWEQAGPSDSIIADRIQQKWWDIVLRFRYLRLWPLSRSLPLTGSAEASCCGVSCSEHRPSYAAGKRGQPLAFQQRGTEALSLWIPEMLSSWVLSTVPWVSGLRSRSIFLQVTLEVTVTLANLMIAAERWP